MSHFRTGDRVLARLYDSSSGRIERITVKATVVEPVSVCAIGYSTLRLNVELPHGKEILDVPEANVLVPPRRPRKGVADEWPVARNTGRASLHREHALRRPSSCREVRTFA